ncbi:lysoplasmalogenase [Rhodococcus sp. G-MC3]|uniref:lysoplasmalogenase n=1 Tax=Rhodococcus sp. G-MC3 TaxID=3046209 RepID=UPI0024B9D44F|nr:lysoplasmalogenase [Rhodococcus sp. G-MC3]MDJ0393335.1 lysoplasmalogenase [Rhodococcus sp. G-MC3]
MNRSDLSRILFASAATATVVGAVSGAERLHRAAKPLMVPALIVGLPTPASMLGGALVAATVGDVLLIDPDDDSRILRGAAAFAVMQTVYCELLRRRGGRPTPINALPRLLGWAAAAAALVFKSPAVAPGLSGYGLTVATMSTLAADPSLAPGAKTVAGVVVPSSNPRSRLAVGGMLFTLSDALIVVRRLFADKDSHRHVLEGLILATYALAQLFLVEGLSGE